jgi:hypothetical protein
MTKEELEEEETEEAYERLIFWMKDSFKKEEEVVVNTWGGLCGLFVLFVFLFCLFVCFVCLFCAICLYDFFYLFCFFFFVFRCSRRSNAIGLGPNLREGKIND